VNKIEKIVLTILAVEHLGFGLYGLYDPNSIAELTGYILNSEFALSEIRAYYTLISALGFMALFAIFIKSIVRQTYILYAFMFGCILSGRIFNYLLTDELVTSIIVAMVAEVLVVGLSLWRLIALSQETKAEI
tara:strand:+ start:42 stop:440 length:399 start_codon:yes stop_codon:yes gene_type:complete